MIKMNTDERLSISVKAAALRKEGKIEEANALLDSLPIPQWLADAVDELEGLGLIRKNYLKDNGFNVSEVN